jgi:hypothetical protein
VRSTVLIARHWDTEASRRQKSFSSLVLAAGCLTSYIFAYTFPPHMKERTIMKTQTVAVSLAMAVLVMATSVVSNNKLTFARGREAERHSR